MADVVTNCDTPPMKAILEPERKSSDVRAVANIVMTAVGLGILELPVLVHSVGYVTFSILLTVICLSQLMMTHVFYRAMKLTPYNQSYAAVAEAAFGVPGKVIGIGVVQLSLIGINACLLVLFAGTMNKVAPISGISEDESRMVWVAIGCALAQPFMWIKKISDIGIFSSGGVVAVFSLAAITIYGGSAQYAKNVAENVDVSYVSQNWEPYNLGFSLCIIVFSFGSVPIIPSVYREMKNPQNFTKVLCTAYAIIFGINAVVAAAGYIGYAKVMSKGGVDSVMALLVPKGEPIDFLGGLASFVAVVIVLTHIFVLFRPVSDASQELGEHLMGNSEVVRKLSRSLPSLIIMAIALGVKQLDLLVLLVAAVTVMIMCLQLPPILYMRMLYLRGDSLNKPLTWVLSAVIVLIGFYAMGVGCHFAVQALSK